MTSYSRSASQFLASSFRPFGAGDDASSQAPLFFSTLDGTSIPGHLDSRSDVDEEDPYYPTGSQQPEAGTSRGRHDAYQLPYRATRDSVIHEQEEEASSSDTSESKHRTGYSHDGLGKPSSEAGSDTSDGPFRSHGVSSRRSGSPFSSDKQRTLAAGNAPPWRAYVPSVKQSVLQGIYEQSESVYTSVFIGGKADKGKQRADDGGPNDAHLLRGPEERRNIASPASPSKSPLATTHFGEGRSSAEGSSLFVHKQYDRTVSAEDSTQQRVYHFPLPPSRLRNWRGSGDNAVSEPEWEDQSVRDPIWLAIYLFNLLFTLILAFYLLLFDQTPKLPTSHLVAPSLAILRAIPLLSLLVFLSFSVVTATLAYTLLLRNGARQAVYGFILCPPVLFLFGAGWAFQASFGSGSIASDDAFANSSSSWVSSTLRWLSLLLFTCSALALRRSWKAFSSTGTHSQHSRIERTIRVLQVSADIILHHPQLMLLAFVLVSAYILMSVPAILIVAKLLLHGMLQSTAGDAADRYSFLVPSTGSILLSAHTAFVYFWTLGLLRATYQHTIAGTVATWWYHQAKDTAKTRDRKEASMERQTKLPERPSIRQAGQNVSEALHRAIGPALGTLCAASLILAILSLLNLIISISYTLIGHSRRMTSVNFASKLYRGIIAYIAIPLAAVLGGLVRNINSFTLVYAAITGDKFWDASHQAIDLILGRNGTDMVASHLMIRSLLSIFSFALALLGALAGYISSSYMIAGTSEYPAEAAKDVAHLTPVLVAFTCGIVPFWTVRFSSDLLSNAVDATFVCFNIDIDHDDVKHEQAYDAFAYEDVTDQGAMHDNEEVERDSEAGMGMSQLYEQSP